MLLSVDISRLNTGIRSIDYCKLASSNIDNGEDKAILLEMVRRNGEK